jgi:RNA polymerase sigma-70 factor (ECF subfamily)
MQAGDGTSVADLASTFGPRIQQLALRYVKNWEDAEEVTQDVLMKVYRKIDAFRGDAALSSWIYRITFNTAMSRLRSTRASRMKEVQSPELDRNQGAPGACRLVVARDDHVLRGQMRERLIESLTHS